MLLISKSQESFIRSTEPTVLEQANTLEVPLTFILVLKMQDLKDEKESKEISFVEFV